ncbi:tetratricopeptide repeat protein [Candidatus Fermentibacteria bacterium]|nr:tetratricopeptide repeat protein [Candidatus Fermentibacteria bacterium]
MLNLELVSPIIIRGAVIKDGRFRELLERISSLRKQGKLAESLELSESLLQTVREEADPELFEEAVMRYGFALRDMGKTEKATTFIEEAYRSSRDRGNERIEMLSASGLGIVYAKRLMWPIARKYLEEACRIAARRRDKRREAAFNGDLAQVYHRMGNLEAALEHAGRQLSLSASVQDKSLISLGLSNMGKTLLYLADNGRASHCFLEQLELERELGNKTREVIALGNLGVAYLGRHRPKKAVEPLREQADLARTIGFDDGLKMALGNLGVAYRMLGRLEEADDCFQKQFSLAWKINDHREMTGALGNRSRIAALRGKLDQAFELNRKYLRYGEQHDEKAIIANGLGNEALFHVLKGDTESAGQAFRRLAHTYGRMNRTADRVGSLLTMLEMAPPEEVDALEVLSTAEKLSEDIQTDDLALRLALASTRHRSADAAKLADLSDLASGTRGRAMIAEELYRLTGDEKRRNQALEAYEQALEEEPGSLYLLARKNSLERI